LIVLLINPFIDSRAQPIRNYYVVEDLRADWLIYDPSSSLLVPYVPSIHSGYREIHFEINTGLYHDSEIQIKYPPNTGFFLNNTLVDYSSYSATYNYSIDSLSEYFTDSILVASIYTKSTLEELHTRIVTPREDVGRIAQGDIYLSFNNVPYSKTMEFIKIGILLIFTLYAFFLNTGRRIFIQYYNISNSFLRVSVDEFLNRTSKLTRLDFVYIAGLSIVMSFVIFVIINKQDIHHGAGISVTISRLFTSWLILVLVIFFWYLVRIFIISVMSDIFQIREIKVIHTFELLRLTNFFSLLFFIVISAALFVLEMPFETLGLILTKMFLLFALFRIVVLFFKFLNSTSYKKLYLFAYLCTAEIFPILVGLKLLLKSSFIDNII
jgi:hypothetical protein